MLYNKMSFVVKMYSICLPMRLNSLEAWFHLRKVIIIIILLLCGENKKQSYLNK